MASIRTLVLEYMDREGAAHIRDPPIKHEYCVVWRKTGGDGVSDNSGRCSR